MSDPEYDFSELIRRAPPEALNFQRDLDAIDREMRKIREQINQLQDRRLVLEEMARRLRQIMRVIESAKPEEQQAA